MRASLKIGFWFAVAALVLNGAAYVMVLLSPYPYPVFTRALCYLAYWPAVRSIGWLGDERGNIISVILGTSKRDRRSSRGGTTKPCRECQMREGAK